MLSICFRFNFYIKFYLLWVYNDRFPFSTCTVSDLVLFDSTDTVQPVTKLPITSIFQDASMTSHPTCTLPY